MSILAYSSTTSKPRETFSNSKIYPLAVFRNRRGGFKKQSIMIFKKRYYEMGMATVSFIVAVILSFVGMAIHPEHDIAAGVCMVIAQFLILTASIIGIDYKLNNFGSSTTKPTA